MWWFPQITRPNMHRKNHLWEEKNRIGSLASHLGILDDEFEGLISVEKLSKVRSWYKNIGMYVQKYRDHSITWISFDEAFYPLQWGHLPRHQIIW